MKIEDRLRALGRTTQSEPSPSPAELESFLGKAHGSLARRRIALTVGAVALFALVATGVYSALTTDIFGDSSLGPAGHDDGVTTEEKIPVEVWLVKNGRRDRPVGPQPPGRLYLTHQLTGAGITVSEDTGGSVDLAAATEDALRRLLDFYPNGKAATAIPLGTRLLEVEVAPQARVNLSSFSSGLPQHQLDLALGQIAATLSQGGVHTVRIEEEGELLRVMRTDYETFDEDLLPPIVVETPLNLITPQAFSGYVPLRGTANVYEGTVEYALTVHGRSDAAKHFVTAECGSGCRGAFKTRIKVDVDVPTRAILDVFSSSAEDGSRMFGVSIPVLLCPGPPAVSADAMPYPGLQDCGPGSEGTGEDS